MAYNSIQYQKNREKILEKAALHYQENKEDKKEKVAKYRKENKEKVAEQQAKSYQKNKEKRALYQKKYAAENRESITSYYVKYHKNRRNEDYSFRFIHNLRRRQKNVLKGKMSTTEGLGCSSEELVAHLVSKFTEGMTLDNHGQGEGNWNIEHKIPLSSYEKDSNGDWNINSEYNKKLIHYTNLQPMWEIPNIKKGDKINPEDLQEFLERVI